MLFVYGIIASWNADKSGFVEIIYENLSQKRIDKANKRADKNGFIFLGRGVNTLCKDFKWTIAHGKDVVCRLEGDELHFYSIDNLQNFRNGTETPTPTDEPNLPIREIHEIQAWYKPFWNGSSFKIDSGDSPHIGPSNLKFESSSVYKSGITDSLILLIEECRAKLQK